MIRNFISKLYSLYTPSFFISGGGSANGYVIERSLRFSSASSQYLTRTFGTALSGQTLTVSMWVKRGQVGTRQMLFGASNGVDTSFSIEFSSAGQLAFYAYYKAYSARKLTNTVFRDPSAWIHIVCIQDTTNAVADDRFRIFINGERVTAFAASVNPALNQTLTSASFTTVVIGREAGTATEPFDGYIAEFILNDTQAINQTSFGEINTATGQWVAKKYTGTYGTNGFYLDFKDGTSTATLGYDKSGNNNHWTLTNFTRSAGVNDCWMLDVPAGNGSAGIQPNSNYCVLNPLAVSASTPTLSWANLRATTLTGGGGNSYGTIAIPSSGKFYWEVIHASGATGNVMIGVSVLTPVYSYFWQDTTGSIAYFGLNGNRYINNSAVAYGASYTFNDVIGVAVDVDAGTVTFYKNNVSQGAITYNASGQFPVFADASGTASEVVTINFGQRSFAYTPPTGFKALCTANLPVPSIKKPSDHFNVQLSTGANIKTDSEALFTNELEWIKDRANANNHQLIDSVRGSSAVLQSNTTAAETTYTAPSGSSVGWVWRASDSAAVTNDVGTISSQVSANPTAGFSIVTYTGNGANATVGHGLGIAPKMVIVKKRSATGEWPVYHSGLTSALYGVYLNATAAQYSSSTFWNSTSPTSMVFSLGTTSDSNGNTSTYVAYCFAEIPGYSKFGSYTGNGSADGPFVYCGFRPRFVMVKRTNTNGDWLWMDSARDTQNAMSARLYPNLSQAEDAAPVIQDFTSNGFKLRIAVPYNVSSGTYIYMAFAECPINYANAR